MNNILKMAGGAGLPFVTYQPVTVNNATQSTRSVSSDDATYPRSGRSSSSSGDSEKGQLTSKDLFTLLKDIDGLPSDMENLYNELNRFIDFETLGIPNTTSLSSLYLRAILQIKTAKYNKEVFDTAYKQLEKNGGLNEIAISPSGRVIGINADNNIKLMTFDELKSSEEYRPVTNAELLQLRAEDPSKANFNTLSLLASNGIGMEKVSALIKDNLQKLGTNSETHEGFINGKTQEGLSLLQQLMSSDKATAGTDLDGLYKAKIINKEQLSKIKGVLNYAYLMLPENAKTLLAYKNNGSRENSYNMIYEMLVGTADKTSEISLDLVEDGKGNKPGTKSSDKDNAETADLFTNIIRGQGGTQGQFRMLNLDGYSMSISGTNYPDLSVNASNRVQEGTLLDLFLKYGLQSVTKGGKYAVTFGDQALSQSDLSNIVFLNDRQNIRTILPITQDEQGNIVPDLKFLNEHKELIDLINEKGLNSPEVREQLIKEGIISSVDGLPDLRRFLSYLCVNGMGSSRNINENTVKKETSDENKIKEFEDNVYRSKGKDGDQGKEYKFDWDFKNLGGLWPGDWFGLYDKLYEGTIYIPLTENAVQTKIGSGHSLKQSNEDNMEMIYQQGNLRRELNTQSTSSDLL